jgi:hypothetical protein
MRVRGGTLAGATFIRLALANGDQQVGSSLLISGDRRRVARTEFVAGRPLKKAGVKLCCTFGKIQQTWRRQLKGGNSSDDNPASRVSKYSPENLWLIDNGNWVFTDVRRALCAHGHT